VAVLTTTGADALIGRELGHACSTIPEGPPLIVACVKKSRAPEDDRTTASPCHPLVPAFASAAMRDHVLVRSARSYTSDPARMNAYGVACASSVNALVRESVGPSVVADDDTVVDDVSRPLAERGFRVSA
jgi:hypothetical protein